MFWLVSYSQMTPPAGLQVPALPALDMIRCGRRWCRSCRRRHPAVDSPPLMISLLPSAYRSATAAVEKTESENHGKPVEHCAVRRPKRVGVLPQRTRLDPVTAGVAAHGHRRRDRRVRGGVGARVGLLDEPLVAAVWGDGLVATRGGLGHVAGAHVDRVEPVGVDRRHRGGRVDRRAGVVGPAGDARAVREVVGVDVARPGRRRRPRAVRRGRPRWVRSRRWGCWRR